METRDTINLIREAISLAGDGSNVPYTDEEYDAMYNLLDYIEELHTRSL
jgi:hypothetical protein